MNRILKYKDSLHRFIKDKSCLIEDSSEHNPFILRKIKDSDLIFSVLLLTTLNSQNKKNNITMQGYYSASAVEFMNTMIIFFENEETMNHQIMNLLTISSQKSLQQNLESVKDTFSGNPAQAVSIFVSVMDIYLTGIKSINESNKYELKKNPENNSKSDILKWYLKNDEQKGKKFKLLQRITEESLYEYINKRYVTISEISFTIGFIMGGGCSKQIEKLKRMAKNFALIYKISIDFEAMDEDMDRKGLCKNIVLNLGLQESYERFMDYKQKFIEDAMILDIYTATMKEIIDEIEEKVDTIIDQTSPDLKSNF